MCLLDVLPLGRLVAATQHGDQCVSVLQVVDPVSGPHFEAKLRDCLADLTDIAGLALGEAVDPLNKAELASSVLRVSQPRLELVGQDDFAHMSTITDTFAGGEEDLIAAVRQVTQWSPT